MSQKLTDEERNEHLEWVKRNAEYVWQCNGVDYIIHSLSRVGVVELNGVWYPAVHYRTALDAYEVYTRTRQDFEQSFIRKAETIEAYYKRISS